ncbi:spermatogenesis-associated protein 6 isoform X5 [Anolis sagrei]|uniref:spermatogenesis-associated protein 6 isoform X5 n=1 Tax=Anolis sagrei TaxID=38937 RepID=UPI00351F9B7B
MPPRKGFVCALELHIRTVTCPGVTLKAKDDVYISASIFGQHKKTSCVRAVFPLIFDEKLIFEKVYTNVVDPAGLVAHLEFDTAVLELIQIVPPVGEIVAAYEENTRDFLFPAPKRNRGQQGFVREVLMRKTCNFTVEQPSPSPDVHTWCRSREHIKDETTCDPTLLGSYRPKNVKIMRSLQEKDFHGFSDNYDEHLMSSIVAGQLHPARLLTHSAPPSLQKYSSTPVLNRSSLRERFHSVWSTPVNGEDIHKRVKNILRTHSARQRLTFDDSCLSKEESARTSKTRTSNKKGEVSCIDSSSYNELQSSSSIRQNIMVHLDNGEYWNNQASEYKNKPHRAIFEDSLEKIYRNMYRKASGSISKNK